MLNGTRFWFSSRTMQSCLRHSFVIVVKCQKPLQTVNAVFAGGGDKTVKPIFFNI